MAYRDLPDFLQALEGAGELVRVREEVDPILEIAEISDRTVKAGGPALLFERPKGSSVPVAINVFGSDRRMAMALGAKSIRDLPGHLAEFISMAQEPPTGGWIEKLKALPKLAELASYFPKKVRGAPWQEVVTDGDAVELGSLPILQCWPQDGGRFITFPMVFTKDPETGKRNCGAYRMQVYGNNVTAMHWHPHKDGARHFAQRKGTKAPMEVAVAIGADPAACFAATCPLPPDVDEMMFAGLVRREGIEMTPCGTVDLEVPASAEIVLEGTIDPDERRVEGPFGDHTGYYSLPGEFPVFRVRRMSRRKSAVYHTIVVGPPVQEDCWIGYAIERLFLPLMRLHLPEVVDYHMPFEGVFHNLMIVAIRKQYPGHARKVMHAIWGMGQAMFTKAIVVVDDDVNVHDPREVAWKALNHIDPQRDFEFAQGPMDILDHASRLPCYGSKVGIDATRKWKDEGFDRPWPDEIKMSAEIKALVDKKWEKLGIAAAKRRTAD